MKSSKIQLKWFCGGLLSIAYATFVKITGKFIFHGSYKAIFLSKEAEPFGYYINLIFSALLGIIVLYRSLLFIPSNKVFYEEHPEYKKKSLEWRKRQLRVIPNRLLGVVLVILVIYLIGIIFLKLF